MGGAALHKGNIAEMKTGEGKTLVSTLPAYLNALSGKGVVEKVYVSELGFLMLRIDNLDGTFTTYNLGKHNVEDNIFSNQLICLKKL